MPRPNERPYMPQWLRDERAALRSKHPSLQALGANTNNGGDIPAHDTHHGGRSPGGNDSRRGRSSTGNTRRGGRSSGEANSDQHSNNPHRSHTEQLSRPRDAEGRRRYKLQEQGLRKNVPHVPDGKQSGNLHSKSHSTTIVHPTNSLSPTRDRAFYIKEHLKQELEERVDALMQHGAEDVMMHLTPIYQTDLARARLNDALREEVVDSWDPQAHQAAGQVESGEGSVRVAEDVVDEGKAGDFWCANCDLNTHNMDRCLNMSFSDGSIDGCILCNDLAHDVDQCPKFMQMTMKEKAYLLVYDRGCLPPLRTERGWFGYLLDWLNCDEAIDKNGTIALPSAFPWTPEFAKELCRGSGYEATVALQDEFDVHGDTARLPRDPATANFGRVWETYGHAHVSHEDSQSGQSR
ncbi:hypothetical protein Neosp_008980 [[Neocosmospora] mangrovei]